MSDAQELQAILAARAHGSPGALLTVVQTAGSAYRRAGARMFADAAGRVAGSISGGCLEDDAREHALQAVAAGRARTVRYDTTADGDIVFGSGVGCRGVVQVLIQPLPPPGDPAAHDPLALAAEALRARRPGVLASVFEVGAADGPAAPAVGDWLWLDGPLPAAGFTARLADAALARALAADARAALFQGRGGARRYALAGGGRAEVFLDVVRPARGLLIGGAGHDAAPLARLGKELGWRVRVVDGRRAYLAPERFPGADELIHCPAAEFGARVPVEPGEAAVVMTHNYLHDRDLLRALLRSPAGYIGLLGPRARTERLLADLAAEADGPDLGKFSLERLHGPAGLDLGAESPGQIALSIVAEIEAARAGRAGGPLKHRRGRLH